MEILTVDDLAQRIGEAAGAEVADREIRSSQLLQAHSVIVREMEAHREVLVDMLATSREELETEATNHQACHERMDIVVAASIYVAAEWKGKCFPDDPPDDILASVMEEARAKAEASSTVAEVFEEGPMLSDLDLRGGI